MKLFLARTDIDLNHKDEVISSILVRLLLQSVGGGIMPLEIACTHGNPEVVKLLLQNEDILKEHEPLLVLILSSEFFPNTLRSNII